MEFRCSTCVILSAESSKYEGVFCLKALVVMYVIFLLMLDGRKPVLQHVYPHTHLLKYLNDLKPIVALVLLLVFSLVSEVLDLKLYFADDIHVAVRLRYRLLECLFLVLQLQEHSPHFFEQNAYFQFELCDYSCAPYFVFL